MPLKWSNAPEPGGGKIARVGPLKARVFLDKGEKFFRYIVTLDPEIWGHEPTEAEALQKVEQRLRSTVRRKDASHI